MMHLHSPSRNGTSVRSFIIGNEIKYRRAIHLALVFLLLWGLQVSVTHDHYEESIGLDIACRLCLHGATSGSPLPTTGPITLAIVLGAITPTPSESPFVASHIRIMRVGNDSDEILQNVP